jgi:uncharacterized HAD superfamily protein
MSEQKGLRYNTGKLRYELIPANPLGYLADVYTKGAHKYSIYENENGEKILGKDISLADASGLKKVYDGADNWRNGLSWAETMAAVKRHITAWEKGEDFDSELGTYHLANSAWGLFALMEFYRTHPEMDNRKLPYLQSKRIGTDIDDVLADFVGAYCERFHLPIPEFWMFDKEFWERYESLYSDEEFWLSQKPILSPRELPYEPVVYITSRPEILRGVTERWLFEVNKYPVAPVVFTSDKLTACKEHKVDRFIDDKFSTFAHLNANGIPCYLFDAAHNRRYDVGYKRITRETIKNVL